MDSIVDRISEIQLSDSTKFHLVDTFQSYETYLYKLLQLELKYRKLFLLNLKNREIVNNQEAELQESFLVELYGLAQRRDSIDLVMKYFEVGPITKCKLKKLHQAVIMGSSDDLPSNYDYRDNNDRWVGYIGTNGRQVVDYVIPDYEQIDPLIHQTLDFLNRDEDHPELDHIFIKPFIVHLLLAYIQPFGNGNTRLARVVQHGKIWDSTKKLGNEALPYPAIYLSKNYLLSRSQYRNLIKEVVLSQNDEAWNKWFNYNLNMMDEQLFYTSSNLEKYQMRLK